MTRLPWSRNSTPVGECDGDGIWRACEVTVLLKEPHAVLCYLLRSSLDRWWYGLKEAACVLIVLLTIMMVSMFQLPFLFIFTSVSRTSCSVHLSSQSSRISALYSNTWGSKFPLVLAASSGRVWGGKLQKGGGAQCLAFCLAMMVTKIQLSPLCIPYWTWILFWFRGSATWNMLITQVGMFGVTESVYHLLIPCLSPSPGGTSRLWPQHSLCSPPFPRPLLIQFIYLQMLWCAEF